jgi:hypothetical protein
MRNLSSTLRALTQCEGGSRTAPPFMHERDPWCAHGGATAVSASGAVRCAHGSSRHENPAVQHDEGLGSSRRNPPAGPDVVSRPGGVSESSGIPGTGGDRVRRRCTCGRYPALPQQR